ncbi:CAF17-like 4Fe-4S cluster assembly/insertion protein YgfZ [Allosalinactinospora lopnorensis]|uniref:CAF17-like 4Fe-4S cluster assembly/insertion protein YgfZ n=1 Tax=Allosalinactinospora lopnorensis TaxID=1352348 RepID=UPI000623C330|nr:glycine cleavage T C-terminal barrel domain-containing protein [Allosalinactinospora lopnorensis]
MISPLLTRAGAVAADDPDTGVAAHYGEPSQEGRALEHGSGWIDRGNRGVVRVAGPDRLGWLHSITSQFLEGVPAGTATEALVMDTKGHINHHMSIVEDGTAVWAHTEPGGGAGLAEFLDSMRFMLRVEIADLSDQRSVLTLAGPERDQALSAVAGQLEDTPVRRTGDEIDLFLPADTLPTVTEALTGAGVRPVGLWAYEAHRIAAHRPRLGLDTDHRAIPHEMGWVGSAVHLEKGCYPGQETIARVHNLGRPPRRLVLLHLDGTAERLPERGSAIQLDGRPVGNVGSSARHHELGPIALGLVKRSIPVDAQFTVDGIAAAQEVIVSPDTGANANIELRRRPR